MGSAQAGKRAIKATHNLQSRTHRQLRNAATSAADRLCNLSFCKLIASAALFKTCAKHSRVHADMCVGGGGVGGGGGGAGAGAVAVAGGCGGGVRVGKRNT